MTAAISLLGYCRNSAARALVTRCTGSIGVLTKGSALYGPTSTLMALEEAAREAGCFVSAATIRQLDAQTMDGVLEHFTISVSVDQRLGARLATEPPTGPGES